MKKVIITTALIISFLQIGFNQENDTWQRQMEDLHQRMQEMTEQLSKQFGGKGFFFDTSFVQPFDFRSLDGMPFDTAFVKQFEFRNFDGENFSFDTSMIREFRLEGFGDAPIEIDTFFFRQFKNFDPSEFPNLNLDEEWSKGMGEMMQKLMQQLEGLGKEFDGQQYPFKEWKSKPEEKGEENLQPKPAPQKKRKTTTI